MSHIQTLNILLKGCYCEDNKICSHLKHWSNYPKSYFLKGIIFKLRNSRVIFTQTGIKKSNQVLVTYNKMLIPIDNQVLSLKKVLCFIHLLKFDTIILFLKLLREKIYPFNYFWVSCFNINFNSIYQTCANHGPWAKFGFRTFILWLAIVSNLKIFSFSF